LSNKTIKSFNPNFYQSSNFTHKIDFSKYTNTRKKLENINDLCILILLKIRNFPILQYFIQMYKQLFIEYSKYREEFDKTFLHDYLDIETNAAFNSVTYMDKLKVALQDHLQAMKSSAMSNQQGITDFINLLKIPEKKVTSPLLDLKLTNSSIFDFGSFASYINTLHQDFATNMKDLNSLTINSTISATSVFNKINDTQEALKKITKQFEQLSVVLQTISLQLKESIDPIEEFKKNLSITFIPSNLFVRPSIQTEEMLDVTTVDNDLEEVIKTAVTNMKNFQEDIEHTRDFIDSINTAPTYEKMAEKMTASKSHIQSVIAKLKNVDALKGGGNIDNLKSKWNNKINNIVDKILKEKDNKNIIINDYLNINKINKDIMKINNINSNKTNIMKKYINKIYNNIKSNEQLKQRLDSSIKINNLPSDSKFNLSGGTKFNLPSDSKFNLSGGTVEQLSPFKITSNALQVAFTKHSSDVKEQSEIIMRYNNIWIQFQYHLINMIVQTDVTTFFKTLSLSTIIYYKYVVKEICDNLKKNISSGNQSSMVHGFSFECLYVYLESLEKYFNSINFQLQFCDFWQFKENKKILSDEHEKIIDLKKKSLPPPPAPPQQAPLAEIEYYTYEPSDSVKHKVVLAFQDSKIFHWGLDSKFEPEMNDKAEILIATKVQNTENFNICSYIFMNLIDSIIFMINYEKLKKYKNFYIHMLDSIYRNFNIFLRNDSNIAIKQILYNIIFLKFMKIHYTHDIMKAIKYIIDNDYRYEHFKLEDIIPYLDAETVYNITELKKKYELLQQSNSHNIREFKEQFRLLSAITPTNQETVTTIRQHIKFLKDKNLKLDSDIQNLQKSIQVMRVSAPAPAPVRFWDDYILKYNIFSYVLLDTYFEIITKEHRKQGANINVLYSIYDKIIQKIIQFLNLIDSKDALLFDDIHPNNISKLLDHNSLYFVNFLLLRNQKTSGTLIDITPHKIKIRHVLFSYINIIFSHMNKLTKYYDQFKTIYLENIRNVYDKNHILHLLYKYTNLEDFFIKYFNNMEIIFDKKIYATFVQPPTFELPDSGITITNWYMTDHFKYFDPNDIINKYLNSVINDKKIIDIDLKKNLLIENLSYNDESSFYYGLKLFSILQPLIDSYITDKLSTVEVLKLLRINDINDINNNTPELDQVFKKGERNGRDILTINNTQSCKVLIGDEEKIYKRKYGIDLNFKDLIENYNFTQPIFDQSYKTNSLVARNTGIHRFLSKGKNILTFGIGYSGIGKSYTLFGDTKKQHLGIVQEMFKLIKNLNNIQIRVYEIHGMASPYSSLWNTDTVPVKYSYYNLNDKDYKLEDTNFHSIIRGNHFIPKDTDFLLKFSDHIKKIEDTRKQNNLILANINNPVSSRGILVIDIKGFADTIPFQKTIFDLPGKEDIKHTYNKIKVKNIDISNTIFSNFWSHTTFDEVFKTLITNPILICFIPSLSKVFVEYCNEGNILSLSDSGYYIYILNDEPVTIRLYTLKQLDTNKSDIKTFVGLNSEDKYICFKALHYMCFLIYNNHFDMIISFFQDNVCEKQSDYDTNKMNKDQIRMIYQGYFINEILVGIFEKSTSIMNTSNKSSYKQVEPFKITTLEKALNKGEHPINNVEYIIDENGKSNNFSGLYFKMTDKHAPLNEFRYLIHWFQVLLSQDIGNLPPPFLNADPNLFDNYDFMKRYSKTNPLENLFESTYSTTRNDYLYTALVLVQNTTEKDLSKGYECNKIVKQMILLNDAAPFLTKIN
jgi:hypothetical protein